MVGHTPEFEQNPSPYQDVAVNFVKNLDAKGLTLSSPHHEGMGVVAVGGTNESGDETLFNKVRSQKQAPNGYLIGIGAANVFSMLEAFPPEVEPKAILLFDIDPKAIAEGRAIIEHFKHSDTYPIHILGEDVYSFGQRVFTDYGVCQFKEAIKKHAPLLHKLAAEGRIEMARVDFTKEGLMPEIRSLPDITTSNNVIYLSNISDHIWRGQGIAPDFSFLNTLTPDEPNWNIYIDTLTKGLTYHLRVSSIPPHFELDDFGGSFADLKLQTKPTDLIDGQPEDPVWEDISDWSLDKLLDAYDDFSTQPHQQRRKEHVERSFTWSRENFLKHYEEWKALNGKVDTASRIQPVIYKAPSNPADEQDLLEDARKPYDYEKDFIPVLAQEYWANASTPLDAHAQNLAAKTEDIIDPVTGKKTTVQNLMDYKKIPSTINFLRRVDINYEELVIAKVYQEIKRRLLNKNPHAKTTNKDINQLAQELQFGRPG